MFRKAFFCLLAGTFALTAQQTQRTRPDASADANDEANASANGGRGQTMKQLARGTDYAAASMSPQATLAAEHMLRDGGNAFDAIVAGQAVLGLMQPNLNGMGSDATLLIYDAKDAKGLVAERRRHGAETRHHRVVQDAPERQDSGQRFAALRHRSGA
jgi:gamma-glutamyltranspeptidase